LSAKSRLARLKRNRKRIADAIRRAPRAPPALGPLGQAFNVLRRVPEPLIDASQIAFNNRLLLEAAVAQQNRLEMIQSANMDVSQGGIGPAIVESLQAVAPSIDEIEALAMAASDEELLDEDLVNAVIQEIETGRDVIRRSKQFSPQNLIPNFTDPPKRTRKKTKTDKNMSKALRQANERFRTKKGKLRKGATQAQIMKFAHKLLKKM